MDAVSLAPIAIFTIGSLPVTTTLLLQVIMTLLIIAAFLIVIRRWYVVPGRFQLIMESLLDFVFSQVDKITSDRRKTIKIFPLIFTLFIFVLSSNVFSMIPGLGAFQVVALSGESTNIFRSVLADYSAILMMTLLVVTIAQIVFIWTQGLGKYLKQFFDFSNPINFFIGLMNIISELAKILSLSFRLFGNVFAGEVLLSIMTGLIPFVVPLPFYVLSFFSGVIQAFVFAVLSAVFISGGMEITEQVKKEERAEKVYQGGGEVVTKG